MTSGHPNQAQKLKLLLQHLGLNESEFAQAIGVSASHINRIATGERALDRPSGIVMKGAKAWFGLKTEWWFTNDDEIAEYFDNFSPGQMGTQRRVLPGGAGAFDEHEMKRRQSLEAERPSIEVTSPARSEDVGAAFARVAAERRDAREVLDGLLLAAPPPNADVAWWLRHYLSLLDKHRKSGG